MYWVSGFCLTSIMLSDENEILCLCPLVVINTGDATEGSGSLIRKRLLSPLNRMLLQYQFSGDSLDIGGGFNKSGFSGGNDCCNVPKQGNIHSSRVVSPPLSLSPLGPKLPERESRRCSENAKLDDNDITLKDMEESLDGTVSGSLSFWNEESFRISSESSQDFDVLEKSLTCLLLRRIDGFLAVLNVTGEFLTTFTKLPFAITLASFGSPSAVANGRYRDSDIEIGFKPSLTLNTSHSWQHRSDNVDSNRCDAAHVGKPTTDQCIRAMETTGSNYVEYTANESQRKGEKGIRSCKYSGFNDPDYGKTGGEDNSPPITCSGNERKSMHSPSKVNKNTIGGGVLRYALHLRFLCPSKKSLRLVQRSKSSPASAPARNMNIEGERFYLYNDLRVVFPQRHSDSDEGKLHVEYHFPSDPKYFDISN
ncbi:hypothetical protein FNV43_RR19547 [Rhamnella rubrinervis]|uniref:Atos-like C-terminal domain-containing protein n=1 Tax=Rhamnella rubrinervis TaxID=2594499 RepID=A0A8K0GSI5_9ROSA|nr:hypothetical protein FNV43_RR19547 [Rhamnella rubrinervis]